MECLTLINISIHLENMIKIRENQTSKKENASFAAGCFWHVEEAFRQILGVSKTMVGYCGGHTKNPSYEQVCSDGTGHAEAVEKEYDPAVASYETLLATFWRIHDPTQRNRQGPDVGSQYRSGIFYYNNDQKKRAEESLKKEQKKYTEKIVTEILPATTFYPAEEYHQHYLHKKGAASCRIR